MTGMVMRRKVIRCVGQSPKTDGKAASQDELQESPCHSSCLARAGTAGRSQEDVGKVPRNHQSHKMLKKHGKRSHKKSHH